jgi:hypothetical protein
MPELIVVASRYLQASCFGKCDELSHLALVDRKRLLYIYVTTGLKTLLREAEVALRWRCDVHNVRLRFRQQNIQIAKVLLDGKPLADLARHEWFAIADSYNFAVFDSLNLLGVVVGNLSTSHDRYFKHGTLLQGTPQNDDGGLRWLVRMDAIPP